MAKAKKTKTAEAKVPKVKETKPVVENEHGLITESPLLNQEEMIEKIMKYLGFDKKRAMTYNYYTKSSRKTQSTFKESELKRLFEE